MKKPKNLYRPIQKKIRLTVEENELLKQRMNQQNVSNFNTYARHLLLTGKFVLIDYSELISLRKEVNRIGVNINQVAKYVNTNEEISSGQFVQLQNDLKKIKTLVDEILHQAKSTGESVEDGCNESKTN